MESYEYHIDIDSVMDRIIKGKNLKSEIDKFVVVDPAFATTRYFRTGDYARWSFARSFLGKVQGVR